MNMNAKRILVFAGIGAAMAMASVAATCGDTTIRTDGNGNPAINGITVTGTGKTTAKPDIAQIQLGISTLAPTVQEARDRAATALDAMLASVKANGVADKDIQTQQFNIQPEYDYRNNEQTLRGFRINNVVSVKLRNIDSTSKVVDDAVQAGGNDTQIQGIFFTIDNPDDLKSEARQKAVADAKQKAQTLADAAGVEVGDALQISESSYTPPVYDASRSFAGADVAAAPAPETPVQPGELDVSVDVSVTWSIK
jgi:uncharacterized protein YggE